MLRRNFVKAVASSTLAWPLTVEIRKASNHTPLEHELKAMTDPHVWFAFWIGVLLVLDKRNVTMSEVYVSGIVDQPQSLWLAESGLAAAHLHVYLQTSDFGYQAEVASPGQ